MKKLTEVDNLFKEKLETMEVKFNPSHWDMLQQSLQSPGFKVETKPEVASKAWSVGKIVAIVLSSALVVLLLVYLFKENKVKVKPQEPIEPETKVQTLPELKTDVESKAEPKILFMPGKDTLLQIKPLAKDSIEKKLQKQLKDSLEESKFIFW